MTNVAVVVPPVFLIGAILFAVLTALALVLSVVMMGQVRKIPDSLGLPRRLRWGLWQPEHSGVTIGQMIYRVRFDPERHPGVVRLQAALRFIHGAVALLVLAFLAWQVFAAFSVPAAQT